MVSFLPRGCHLAACRCAPSKGGFQDVAAHKLGRAVVPRLQAGFQRALRRAAPDLAIWHPQNSMSRWSMKQKMLKAAGATDQQLIQIRMVRS